jgi:hypothetical protein
MTLRDRSTGPWSPYVRWAKESPPARWDLAASNLLHCELRELPGARQALERFGDPGGGRTLEAAVARRFGAAPDRVATAQGASGACFLTLAALAGPGDVVLVESPGYDPHMGAARLLGAEIQKIPRAFSDGFRLDADALARRLTSRVRAIVLTNLHNPSGTYADPWSLMELAALADAVGARIVVDEVYLEAAFDVDTTPAAIRHPAFVSVGSLSKAFGLSGLRVGWVLAEPETAAAVRRVRDVVDGVGAPAMERLGALAMEQVDTLLARARRLLRPNVRLVRRFVEKRDELTWVPPADGSPVSFPRLVGVEDATPFAETAWAEHDVKVAPGVLFGAPEHIRISASGTRENVEGGLDALGRALDRGWG